ncbi:MAG: type II toxin-antitoxin system VapC family toxin [Terriglobia bacterium]
MSFLLDTNIVSEWVKPRPNPGVIAWLAEVDEDRVFLSVITLAELRYGIERLAEGRRRKRIEEWLRDELPVRFEGRLLPVDNAVADAWGKIVAQRETAGRPVGVLDAFIAATAQIHSLTIVTRNAPDFESSVKAIVNPYEENS